MSFSTSLISPRLAWRRTVRYSCGDMPATSFFVHASFCRLTPRLLTSAATTADLPRWSSSSCQSPRSATEHPLAATVAFTTAAGRCSGNDGGPAVHFRAAVRPGGAVVSRVRCRARCREPRVRRRRVGGRAAPASASAIPLGFRRLSRHAHSARRCRGAALVPCVAQQPAGCGATGPWWCPDR